MKVKIGNKWYDSNDEPICIQVSEGEQKQIGEMDRSVAKKGRYAIFPNAQNWTQEQMIEWMNEKPKPPPSFHMREDSDKREPE